MVENEKKEIRPEVITYEKSKMDQVAQMLNSLSVTGVSQANLLCNIFSILNNPINLNK